MNNQYQTRVNGSRKQGLARWQELDNARKGILDRVSKYAGLTIPQVHLPDGVDNNSEAIQHDWSSVGAQAVNHLTNKAMLSLFPRSPFFRLDANREFRMELQAKGITEEDLRESLVEGETDAVRLMDQKALRPMLFELLRHTIVTGNVLLDTSSDDLRFEPLRNFVVKRSLTGKVIEILVYAKVLKDELEDSVKATVSKKQDNDYVEYIKQYRLRNKKWALTQFVDNSQLDKSFGHQWPEKNFPLEVVTWSLAPYQDYGTGLVEEYAGDFGTLSTLSEAEVRLAILMSDYRWLSHPSGVTDPNDFKKTTTGDVIMGRKEDLTLVHSTQVGNNLQYVSATADKVIRRIGQAFLMGSAVTRDAERVTAEEIRLNALELETSLGGVYSRLAVLLQIPLARWLLKQLDVEIGGTKLVPTVITGLDALSRSNEANNLQAFLADLANLQTLGPQVLSTLRLSAIVSTLAAARGIAAKKYVLSEDEIKAQTAQIQQQQTEQVAQQAVATEGAKAAASNQDQ